MLFRAAETAEYFYFLGAPKCPNTFHRQNINIFLGTAKSADIFLFRALQILLYLLLGAVKSDIAAV